MTTRKLKYRDAISEALVQCMADDPNIFIMGIGVDDVKGVWGTTIEAHKRFGERVFDIPNCESAIAGASIGAAAVGKRPVVVHPRNDFMFLTLDEMVNLAAKWKYMYGVERGVPVVVRGVIGRGWGQGATHCQSLQSIFGHFPGLNVAMPATPADIKGLLVSALTGDTPTVILEHRALYDIDGEVPEEKFAIPYGKGRIAREGDDVTIVAPSLMAYEAVRAADLLAEHGVSAEVIDPRSIRPLDRAMIQASVEKTGHLVVADTSHAMYGFSAEIAAMASESCFEALKAPVRRVTPPDHPSPVAKPLEDAFNPSPKSIADACLAVMASEAKTRKVMPDVQARFAGPY